MILSNIERIAWFTVVLVLGISLFIVRSDLNEMKTWIELQNEQLLQIDSMLDRAEQRMDNLRSDEIQNIPRPEFRAAEPVFHNLILPEHELNQLRQIGLENPVNDLKSDLMSKPEIIPVDGVLGGTMQIFSNDDIIVLPGRWVYAQFEDGHIVGSVLLEYEIRDGKVLWTVLNSKQH
jgi:hypothetical protein